MRSASIVMGGVMLAVLAAMTGIALTFPEGARFQPLVIGLPAVALCILQLVLDLRARERSAPDAGVLAEETREVPARREMIAWSYFLGIVAGILLLGFWVAIPIFLLAFLRAEAHAAWSRALGLTLAATAVLYGLFGVVLRVPLHGGFLWQMLPPG